MEFSEIRIPCPWGFIAAKTFGNVKDTHIIFVHGMQDNASSFDLLMEKLPQKGFFFIAIDLPGHGLSSSFSASGPIHYLDFVIAMKCVVDHFAQSEYMFCGHSLGAMISLAFSHCYPQYLSKIVTIDNVFQRNVDRRHFYSWFHANVENYFHTMQQLSSGNVPTYTYDEALQKVLNGRYVSICEAGARNLLKRHLTKVSESRYRFNNSQLLKCYFYWPTDEQYMRDVFEQNPITKPHLFILTRSSKLSYNGSYEHFQKMYEKNPQFVYCELEGNHDLHNNDPQLVADTIMAFFARQKNQL